ncbi:dihydrofolate reductase [Blastopirellula marina]|uniref:dihydrofolate reductase n=2 Tax=Pirellulales TaxID=2691354 RepID=A0A2S8F714_9BACT|nr:dihydrofolate reductase [Blastopirellula marina]RCS48376.1 dihydrofolate reductase [Bremerella cremea]
MHVPVILVGAMTKDRVIGQGDKMPWDIPEEYQTFIDNIRGQTVVMGRKSYDVFGPDLTSAYAIVVSRGDPDVSVPVAHGIDKALKLAHSYGKKVFVAGGSQIYELALPHANRMYLSEIKQDYAGDRYFPEFDRQQWQIVREDEHARFIYREWKRLG